MYSTVYAIHSGWRWLVLLAVLVAVGYGLWGLLTKQSWQGLSRKILVTATIVLDIQLLIGIVLYITGTYWSSNAAGPKIAHPFMMILAIVMIHVTNVRIKRAENDSTKFRWLALGTLATLMLILVGITMLVGGSSRIFQMNSI